MKILRAMNKANGRNIVGARLTTPTQTGGHHLTDLNRRVSPAWSLAGDVSGSGKASQVNVDADFHF